jgi:hypothetical protein
MMSMIERQALSIILENAEVAASNCGSSTTNPYAVQASERRDPQRP